MTSIIPIGTVVPFAGVWDPDLQFDGWLPCNGQSLDPNDPDYHALFETIGVLYGGTGNTSFNLPDLRGLFLRGADDGSNHDPDALARYSIQDQAFGGGIATLQSYATKLPGTNFTSEMPHLPDDHHKGNVGSLIGEWYADWADGSITATVGGGDKESRPVNIYVIYLIKYMNDDDSESIPIGGLIPFAGADWSTANYMLCDGAELVSKNNREIYSAIGTANGGNGTPNFNLPDYRGRFLRAVSDSTNRDPDKDSRTAPQASGNTGNLVGSIQGGATGLPTTADFKASIPNVPTDDSRIDDIAGRSTSADNGGSVGVNLASGGGDTETRPVNIYVDWYIRTK